MNRPGWTFGNKIEVACLALCGMLGSSLFLPLSLSAEELPIFYKGGVRPLGMGGAFTAVADDENAMFYNPAGLNKIKGFGGVDLLPPLVEVSENTIEFLGDLKDVAEAPTDTQQATLAADLLNNYLGEHLHLRTSLFPNLTIHNFGIGILAQGVFDGVVHSSSGANVLEVDGTADLALLVSSASGFQLLGRPLQVGITGKVINRRRVDETYTAFRLVQQDGVDLDQNVMRGTGFGFDLGLIYTLPIPLDPSLGLTLQNVTDLDMEDAGQLDRQLNAGLAIPLPIPIGLGKTVVAVDMMDITKALGSDNDLMKRLHAGIEYKLPVILAIRGGLNQGYPSAGATLDFWLLKLDYAYYVEEIGAFSGQTANKRHAAMLSVGF